MENRPTRVAWAGGTNDLVYDGNGIRYKKTGGGQTNVFHYDKGGRLLFETDENGVVQACYLYARNSLVAMVQPAAETYFYHFNQVGHAVALTDRTGNVTTRYAYEPYGMVTASGAAVRNPFTYVAAAGVYDDGDELFYMKNRYYDARAGRFLSKDPLGIVGSGNLYAYAEGNPTRFVDPSGLSAADVVEVIVEIGGSEIAKDVASDVVQNTGEQMMQNRSTSLGLSDGVAIVGGAAMDVAIKVMLRAVFPPLLPAYEVYDLANTAGTAFDAIHTACSTPPPGDELPTTPWKVAPWLNKRMAENEKPKDPEPKAETYWDKLTAFKKTVDKIGSQ